MSSVPAAEVAPRGYRRLSRWRHFTVQSAPLLLAWIILALTLVAWIAFYYNDQDTFPTGFDWLSFLNTSMPLVFVAVGQSVVVLTRGLDLSVGGMISITVSLAATRMGAGAGDMVLWSVLILLVGAAGGAVNGLLVAYARLQRMREEVPTGYDGKALDAFAARARHWSRAKRDSYIFMINGAKVRAPASALALQEILTR